MAGDTDALELATELTVAWLSNPNTRAGTDDVPAFLVRVHQAVNELVASAAETPEEQADLEYVPAVSARKSLANKDHIISMIDGKPYRTLRRHLTTNGLTPEQYRERYKLNADYPMIAKGHSEARRAMAKKIGLGRKSRNIKPQTALQEQAPMPKGRRKAAPAT